MDGYYCMCTFDDTVNSIKQSLNKNLPRNRGCRGNTGFPTFSRRQNIPGSNWIWYHHRQKTQTGSNISTWKESTYLSPLFCRMHPSIISFTSGIATLSKLAGLTPWNIQVTEKLEGSFDLTFDCVYRQTIFIQQITGLNSLLVQIIEKSDPNLTVHLFVSDFCKNVSSFLFLSCTSTTEGFGRRVLYSNDRRTI